VRELKELTITGKRSAGTSFKDLAISDCHFEGCYLSGQRLPGSWTSIRNIHLRNVKNSSCGIETAKFEACYVHNLTRQGKIPLFMWGCVYSEVSLSGKIGAIKMNRSVGAGEAAKADQAAWDRATKDFYAGVDWALDISSAKFAGSVSFEAIPGDKIRRDPETQVLVTRQALADERWRQLDFGRSGFEVAISWFLQESLFDSVVLAARMGSGDAKSDIAVLRLLVDKGFAS